MSHTILFVQCGIDPETRICIDYNSVEECMDGICRLYEGYQMNLNSTVSTVTYDMDQLFAFIDDPIYISCLVYQRDSMTYVVFDKQWIKMQLLIRFLRQVNQRQ